MATVRGYSADEVDALVDDFTLVVQHSLQTTYDKTAAALPRAIVASAGLSPTDAAVATTFWQEEVDGVLTPYIAQTFTGTATSVALSTATAFPDVDLPGVPVLPDDYALAYVKSRLDTLYGVGDEVWEDIRNELITGIQDGSSTEQVAARIQHLTQLDQQTASKIARTEMHSAVESGNHTQLTFMGYADDEVTKTWEYTHDGRTRPTHVAAGGQKRMLHEPFSVGGSSLQFPGDPTGAADEIIHCRCTAIYDFDTAPEIRCGGSLVAAKAAAAGTACAIPLAPADIGVLGSDVTLMLWELFTQHKISPAYGGAKIHKVVADVRAELKAGTHTQQMLEAMISDRQIVAAVDKHYAAKGATFSQKYDEWLQSPAGMKVVGAQPAAPKGVVIPASQPVTLPVAPTTTTLPSPLPSIPGKPKPGDIMYTGKSFKGITGAQVWKNNLTGDEWLFKKYDPVSYSGSYATTLEPAIARVMSKAGLQRPAVYEITLHGQQGSLQYMFPGATKAWETGSAFNPATMSASELLTVQREQIFDWMISNHDSHTGQWIRLSDGTLYGIDKGQAFKYFGNDKLDWDYTPVKFQHPNGAVYQRMWQEYVSGKSVALQDPTTGALGAYVDQLTAVSDADYRKILRPYAEARYSGKAVDDFLDRAVARKNSLKKDFADFWARAQAERAKHVKVPVPTPGAPSTKALDDLAKVLGGEELPPTAAPATVGNLGDISSYNLAYREQMLEDWLSFGGGKKVTPAWGGAKIWKLLQDLKHKSDADWKAYVDPTGAGAPNELQLLRILDDVGGFKGKPKTYESVLTEWLASPAGKKAVVDVPQSLKPVPKPSAPVSVIGVPAPKPVAAPVVSPAATNKILKVFETGTPTKLNDIVASLSKYEFGDVVAYGKTGEGLSTIVFRVTKYSDTEFNVEVQQAADPTQWTTIAAGTKFKTQLEGINWVEVPPKVVPASKVAGKGPGDVVTIDEISATKYLWKDGDVVVQADAPFSSIKLESNGSGGFTVWWKSKPTDEWGVLVTPGDTLEWAKLTGAEWKLTNDVLITSKQSAVAAANVHAGDVVGHVVLMSTPFQSPNGVMAYGIAGQTAYRLRVIDGVRVVQTRPAGTSGEWKGLATIPNIQSLDTWTPNGMKWYAANLDGSVPDALKAVQVGSKVAGVKSPSNIPNYVVGEHINEFDIMEQVNEPHAPGTVIATGTSQNATKWAVMYDTDDQLHLKFYDTLAEKWMESGVVEDPSELPTMQGGWAASDLKIEPAKPVSYAAQQKAAVPTPPKATKATGKPPKVQLGTTTLKPGETHIPGKKTGEFVSSHEIWTNFHKYAEGEIVAISQKYSGNYRVFVADGKLIQQKQTKAGNWAGTTQITSQWQISATTAAQGFVDAKHYTAAMKLVSPTHQAEAAAKKAAAAAAKPVKQATALADALAAKHPPSLEHAKASYAHLTEDQKNEILADFKGASIGQLLSSSDEDLLSNLWTLAASFSEAPGFGRLSVVQVARIIDEMYAKKQGKSNAGLFETKITKYLNSSAGQSYVSTGKFKSNPIVTEILQTEVDLPPGVVLTGQQRMFVVRGLDAIGPYDPAKPASAFRPTNAPMMQQMQDQMLARHKWTAKERAALRSYTSGAYTSWNGYLRNLPGWSKANANIRSKVLHAQAGMRPSTEDILVLRGTGWEQFPVGYRTPAEAEKLVGKTIQDPAFLSTSTSQDFGGFGGALRLEIEVPKGTPIAFVKSISYNKRENEVILPAGMKYHVISVKPNGWGAIVRLRVVSS